MRVAFATRDGTCADAELRRAPRVDVYDVDDGVARLLHSCALDEARAGTSVRIRAISGAEIVFVSAIGPSDAARLAAHGIRAAPAGGERIDLLLARLGARPGGAGPTGPGTPLP